MEMLPNTLPAEIDRTISEHKKFVRLAEVAIDDPNFQYLRIRYGELATARRAEF